MINVTDHMFSEDHKQNVQEYKEALANCDDPKKTASLFAICDAPKDEKKTTDASTGDCAEVSAQTSSNIVEASTHTDEAWPSCTPEASPAQAWPDVSWNDGWWRFH